MSSPEPVAPGASTAQPRPGFVERAGEALTRRVSVICYALGFFIEILRETVASFGRRKVGSRVLAMQILFTGVEALAVTAVIAVGLGAVIIVQGTSLLPQFGQIQLLYVILITVITRELGPILTAVIVASRSGTAITTELGNMVINHEVEAYIASGINPIAYLVVPRFLGVIISMVVLNLYFNIFGLLGSWMVTQLIQPVEFVQYFHGLFGALSVVDVLSSLVKSVIFGAIVSTVATFHGFRVERSSTEVPQMAIKSVGQGFILLMFANAVITLVYYL